MFFDFIYLLILLSAVVILVENRLSRIIRLLGIQGFLLIFPVFHFHGLKDIHAWILVGLILFFKAFLTPMILSWTARKSGALENTHPRFGYIATLFFLLVGLIFTIHIIKLIEDFPIDIHKLAFSYVMLLIYTGIIAFIVRTHWIPLVTGFVVFENGIFALTLLLQAKLPLGVEMGAFVDAVLVIVSAAALRMRSNLQGISEVKV
ncbi:MAG: formate hydrogenase [Leptospiraceae bacterium]|nr:formate hydrogenase [Leptospiraceae bacterium]MCK6380659.1 formate hydrogenase [Leptospiraceae bacterium]NUM41527.1 formate hydrogenase [Leptospiraceae bacterium]